MTGLGFSARNWLTSFEAAGGTFHIIGSGAFTQTPTARSERLSRRILSSPRRWVAVYQLAAALGPAPRRNVNV
jgi:hypothetical protein